MQSYVSNRLKDWDDWLDCVESAHNKAIVSTHGMSPFSLVYHYDPLSPPDLELALFQDLPLRGKLDNASDKPTTKTPAARNMPYP